MESMDISVKDIWTLFMRLSPAETESHGCFEAH